MRNRFLYECRTFVCYLNLDFGVLLRCENTTTTTITTVVMRMQLYWRKLNFIIISENQMYLLNCIEMLVCIAVEYVWGMVKKCVLLYGIRTLWPVRNVA